ncbi:MAG TPA: STAS domain-containing protein [Stellaceae bacterium]|nr:STAS domain-containing protein [Stellaceae bacterium]
MSDGILAVRPQGRLDSLSGPAFEKELLAHIEGGCRQMVLDFSGLNYISSAGLRVVLVAAKRMKAAGGKLVLASLNAQIHEVFEISGFNRILEIEADYAAAAARLLA